MQRTKVSTSNVLLTYFCFYCNIYYNCDERRLRESAPTNIILLPKILALYWVFFCECKSVFSAFECCSTAVHFLLFCVFFVSPSRLIDWFIHWLNNNCFSKWTIKRFNPAVWYVIITASSFSYTVYVWHADKLYIMMTVYAYSVGVSLQHWRRQTRLQYICCHRHHHSCVALIYSMHYEETYIKS